MRNSRGNHAAAITSSCWPTSTESPGRMRLSATRSLCAGGGAAAMSRRASGDTAVASPVAALSTVTVSGGVVISRGPCRTRTGPITSVPGRWVLSRSSRVMVRTGPPTAAAGSAARGSAASTPTGRRLVLAAATAVPDRELEVPFRRAVTRSQQQGFPVRALGVGQMRVAARGVVVGLLQRQQAKVVQRAEPQIGIERCGGVREAGPGGLGVRVSECRGARVVPGGILLATRDELRQVGDAGAPEVMAVPCFLREAPPPRASLAPRRPRRRAYRLVAPSR